MCQSGCVNPHHSMEKGSGCEAGLSWPGDAESFHVGLICQRNSYSRWEYRNKFLFTQNLQLLTFELGMWNSRTIWIAFGEMEAYGREAAVRSSVLRLSQGCQVQMDRWDAWRFAFLAARGSAENEIWEQETELTFPSLGVGESSSRKIHNCLSQYQVTWG